MSSPTKWLYLHGFASGPNSYKGVALAEHYERRGVRMERLNLRLPSLEHLRLSAIIAAARQAIGGDGDRAVLFGSSLGGLAAARAAEEDPRVQALVLLAPGFQVETTFRRALGPELWQRWEESGELEFDDYARKGKTRVDFGFIRDARAVEARAWPEARVPTLIVHGRQDKLADIEFSRAWAQGKPGVRLVEVDDGHELTASLPRITTEADEFLAPFLKS
ncbi:MAG: alpha/beta fold hydrolase [Elusimicrobia bacterium]|nr:alpha/beta fold hydrolase [Elusimicrobiota bacterium]